MGKKSKPPKAPDYAAIATNQAMLNKQAADQQTETNRPNQNTAFGSTQWDKDAEGNWTQNVTLNAADQAALDSTRAFNAQKQNIASGLLGRAGESMSTPLSYEGLPQGQEYDMSKLGNYGQMDMSQMGAYGQMDPSQLSNYGQMDPSQLSNYGQLNTQGLQDFGGYDPSSLVAYQGPGSLNDLPELNTKVQTTGGGSGFSMGNAPGLKDIDMSKLQSGFGAVEGVRDAMMARMNPQRQQLRESELQRLKNQGLSENSEAFQRAMTRLDQGDTDAQQQALLGAAGEYGNIFNRELAGQQANTSNTRANRSQLATEAKYGAEESRLGAGQAFNQNLGAAQFGNQARDQNFNERLGLAGESRAARGQQFGEQGTMANYANNVRGQQFGENQAAANFANTVRGQQYGEQAGNAAFANTVRGQQYGEQAGNAAFQNAVRGQQYGEQAGNAALQNATRGQQFGEQGAAANMAQALRNAGINERTTLRNSPMADFNMFQGNAPTGLPQMPSFMAGTGYEAADQAGAADKTYQAQMNAFNAKQAQQQALQKGLFGLAGAAMTGGTSSLLGGALGMGK